MLSVEDAQNFQDIFFWSTTGNYSSGATQHCRYCGMLLDTLKISMF